MKDIRYWKATAVLFFLVFVADIQAQIPPPEFSCVRNDTLFWDIPMVGCGTVTSYDIYASTDFTGPYMLLGTVADATADLYFHVNPAGDTYYYYLLTNADCPGMQSTPSDTLDNRPPPEIPIDYVSVVNAKAEIGWTEVSNPDILGYAIYRVTPLGTVAIDTVFNGGTYIDQNSNPESEVEFYYVNGIDKCGIASFFDVPHHTILLEYQVDSCAQTAQLNWNAYDTWSDGVSGYAIMVSEDGAPAVEINQVNGNQTSYLMTNLDKNILYSIYVTAKRTNGDDEAASNAVVFQPNIVQTLQGINLFNADIGTSDELTLTWTWDPSAQIQTVDILYFLDGEIDRITISTDIPSQGLQLLHTWTLTNLDLTVGPYVFIIRAVDECGDIIESNLLYSIFLEGRDGSDQSNNMIWNSPITTNRLIETSDLYRLDGPAGLALIASLPVTAITFADNTPNVLSSCYQLLFSGEVTLYDGSVYEFEQHSNLACLSKPVRFYMPNAISPKGTNRIYKPSIINESNIQEYNLSIFDRWGNRLFQSIHPAIGWDGTANGKYVNEGVYIYRLQITQSGGEKIDQNGTIHLIY